MSQERSTAQTTGGIDQAISNLDAIKSGEDPRVSDDVDITVSELPAMWSVKSKRHSPAFDRTRDEIHDKFVQLLNTVQPDHPYVDDPYPVERCDVETSYHRRDSDVWASCGPCRTPRSCVSFSVDLSTFESARPGFLWMVLAHEVAHVEYGSHNESSGHRPEFWRSMADAVVDVIESVTGSGCRDGLVGHRSSDGEFVSNIVQQAYYDVHSGNTDQRSMSVGEQRQAVLDRISSEFRRRGMNVRVDAKKQKELR